jgi:hypothetical protein
VATSTLAKLLNSHPLFAARVRLSARSSCPKPQPHFRVFPTGDAEYHWRIAALANNRTISQHKSLSFALRKCTRLNEQRGRGARNETN